MALNMMFYYNDDVFVNGQTDGFDFVKLISCCKENSKKLAIENVDYLILALANIRIEAYTSYDRNEEKYVNVFIN